MENTAMIVYPYQKLEVIIIFCYEIKKIDGFRDKWVNKWADGEFSLSDQIIISYICPFLICLITTKGSYLYKINIG